MNLQTIQEQLKSLRLTAAALELEDVLNRHKGMAELDWVSDLLSREMDSRREKTLQARIKGARFPEVTSLEAFDWKFNPSIDQNKIRELASCKFVEQNEIALFLGKPGTGKTHLALAIGVLAVHQGHRVYCSSIKKLIQDITVAKAKNALDLLFRKILSAHLWIIDDWGVVSMNRDTAEEIFDLFNRRKYSSAMLLTSNRDVGEWGEVFPDPILAGSTIDRIFERAEIVLFEGKSYRMKGKIMIKDGVEEKA